METKQGSPHARLLGDSTVDSSSDDREGSRACLAIVIR
ncbi:hypothetical protein CCACVL1_11642 [Corchorus capsularis]|uniref:Uncharacterized protein n=1 Tax=Corchorus capsularis TaxID=210143 RepID=A0A1R3IK68_COCAP|nr:hypothetical protein CCACVL1_11642 [Corchorus capsularis]